MKETTIHDKSMMDTVTDGEMCSNSDARNQAGG